MRVAAAPVEGAANDAIVDFLADRLGVPRRAVTLAAGLVTSIETDMQDLVSNALFRSFNALSRELEESAAGMLDGWLVHDATDADALDMIWRRREEFAPPGHGRRSCHEHSIRRHAAGQPLAPAPPHMEFGKHIGKGIWGVAGKGLPVLYGFAYVLLVIRVLPV